MRTVGLVVGTGRGGMTRVGAGAGTGGGGGCGEGGAAVADALAEALRSARGPLFSQATESARTASIGPRGIAGF